MPITDAESYVERVNRLRLYIQYRGDACEICGQTHIMEVYHLHHVDPSTKERQLKVAWWTKNLGAPGGGTWNEAQKCALLCANCHAEEHAALRKGYSLLPEGYCTPDGTNIRDNHGRDTHESEADTD